MLEAMLMGGGGGLKVSNTWTQRVSMPSVGRERHMGAIIDGKLHIAGGRSSINPSVFRKDHWCYDPAQDSWTAKADLPVARGMSDGCVIDGKWYVFGGTTAAGGLSELLCYDPVANTWTTKAAGPGLRQGPLVEAIGTKMYVFGGSTALTMHCYETLTNTWTTLSAYSVFTANRPMTAIGSKLYIAGISTQDLSFICYDTLTDTWEYLGEAPVAFSSGGASVVDGKLYILHRGANHPMYVYDPVVGSWSLLKLTDGTQRGAHVAETLAGEIYIMGGFDANIAKYIADLWRYTP